jgi:FMN phosphatase YigB (HAD superfamily)
MRPLLVTDCDEVLLNMIGHFAAWLEEAQGLHFCLDEAHWPNSLLDRPGGEPVGADRARGLLHAFLETEMDRQDPVPGAVEVLRTLAEAADIVVLTNIDPRFHEARLAQLARCGISHRLVCGSGGKGAKVAALMLETGAPATVFVDDRLAQIASVAAEAPSAWRLHMVAEPRVARNLPPAPEAHARIDSWAEALPWILEKLGE